MPEGEIYIEKRRHRRVDKKLKVTYKITATEEEAEDINLNRQKVSVLSVDISLAGMQLICDEDIPIDKIVRLDVEVEGEDKPLVTFAEVRWVSKDEKLNKYRVGMEFLVIKQEHTDVIKKITGE